MYIDVEQVMPRHGWTTLPPSRVLFCREGENQGCAVAGSNAAGIEAPKGWPDAPASPADGKLASGGHTAYAAVDGPLAPDGRPWKRTTVRPGQLYKMEWYLTAPHKTQRWRCFLTKPGWDPRRPLSRAQFDLKPFMELEWWCDDKGPSGGWTCKMPINQVVHWAFLPDDRRGYHVLYAVWDVADTGNAFYQVADLEFT